jgi:hypothetical protein
MRADSAGTGHQPTLTDAMIVTADKTTTAGTLSGVVNMIETIKPLVRILLLASIILVPLAVLAQVSDLDRGLVAYYPFNGNANDESGNEHDGEMLDVGTFTQNRFGEDAAALSLINNDFQTKFVGLEQYAPTTEKRMFVSFWATKDLATPNTAVLAQYIDPPNKNTFSIVLIDNNLNVSGNGYNSFRGQPNELSSSEWQHWGILISPGDGNSKVYFNGEFLSSGSLSLNENDVDTPFHIGMVNGRKPSNAKGALDDIRIYNRALSEVEVSALHELESKPPFDFNKGLVAYYPFNGNANDESGNGHDGTVNGAVFNRG